MLILSRKLNETIVIGENIRITLINIDRGKIRLAIDAPKEVSILRSEIYEQYRDGPKGTES